MRKFIAYSHIPKAGGTTIIHLLRSHFGFRHVDAEHRFPTESLSRWYRMEDWNLDNRLHLGFKSIAGHSLKPFLDYGKFNNQIKWYTFMRDPLKRSFSQYVQDLQLGRIDKSLNFSDWASIDKLGKRNRNAQACQLAGIESAEAAISVIENKKIFVGLLEQFDLSLKMWRDFINIPGFSLNYGQPKNVRSKNPLVDELRERQPALKESLEAHNKEDIVLYNYVRDTIFPRQKVQFCVPDRISLETVGLPYKLKCHLRILENRVYRNFAYKPAVKIHKLCCPVIS